MRHFPKPPRLQLFEFFEQSWFQGELRASYLRCMNLASILLSAPTAFSQEFVKWLQKHEAKTVMDIASGGGGHLVSILEDIEDTETTIVLSDPVPEREIYLEIMRYYPYNVDAFSQPVEPFSAVSSRRTPQCMSLFGGLHHLDEAEIRTLFESAFENDKKLFIAEIVERSWCSLLLLTPLAGLLACIYPLLAPQYGLPVRKSDLLFCMLFPLVPIAFAVDAAVSILRSYSAEELRVLLPEQEAASVFDVQEQKVAALFRIRTFHFERNEIVEDERAEAPSLSLAGGM